MPDCPCCGKAMIPWCGVPGCKAHTEQYSRIVGYLTPVSHWNDGKRQEWEDRTTYTHLAKQPIDESKPTDK